MPSPCLPDTTLEYKRVGFGIFDGALVCLNWPVLVGVVVGACPADKNNNVLEIYTKFGYHLI